MTEQAFLILTALLAGPRHGYGILAEVTQLSQQRVELKVGTLYGVLDRLVGDGLVVLDREEPHQGRLRRYYAITDAGSNALAARGGAAGGEHLAGRPAVAGAPTGDPPGTGRRRGMPACSNSGTG